MDKKRADWILWVSTLAVSLLGVAALSLSSGSTSISMKKALYLLFKGMGGAEYTILFEVRLPRIILGIAIGGALSLAGVVLQGMFRNPLVEPYTLGISGGAALGVSVGILLRLHRIAASFTLPLLGFLGAVLIIILIYSLSVKRGVLRIQGLLLTGVMISFISSALIMLILAISRTEDLRGIIFWMMGSLEETNPTLINIMLFTSTLGVVTAYLYQLDLNAMALGEEEALHLGINVERTKRDLFILASLLTGSSVSVAGIIGFVGLAVPHITRIFVGRDHRILIIASYLAGGIFLLLCDTLARTIIAPLELPVGVITGILGGSLFIYAITKKNIIAG